MNDPMNVLSTTLEPTVNMPESTAPLLRVEGLSHAFGGQQVLKDVSLELHRGEVVLLRGANGSGKTTLLNILTGNLVPDRGSIELHTLREPVRFEFPRRWGAGWGGSKFAPDRLARLGLGRTWQDIRLFDTQSLANNIAVASPHQIGENPLWAVLRRSGVMRQEGKVQQVARLRLADLGLGDRADSSADRVSLGQSKRVAIARAIQAGVKILCLDEPLAGLDAGGIEEVMGMLRDLAVTERVTLVIVEHVFNIPRILDLATTVWTLAAGEISIESAEAVRLQPELGGAVGIEDWLSKLGRAMVTRELAGGAVLKVVRVPGVEVGEVTLAVTDLVVYRGKRLVVGDVGADGQVRGLSFELRRGELAVLLAPNGWGKTTLLEALMGLVLIDRGTIKLGGDDIQNMMIWERVGLGLTFLQSRDNLFPTFTVRETLKLNQVTNISDKIQDLVDKRMTDLSGGERQRLITSYTFDGQPFNTALLDEPFSALDSGGTAVVQASMLDSLSRASLLVAVPQCL